jgi:hypothetical protein
VKIIVDRLSGLYYKAIIESERGLKMARVVNIIPLPVGGYGFAGSVPIDLAYDIRGGSCFDREKVRKAIPQVGPGIARQMANRLGVKMSSRRYDTQSEAYDAACDYQRVSGLAFDIN